LEEFSVFSVVEWRSKWTGAARWMGSDRREIYDEYRLYVLQGGESTSDCMRVRVK